MNFQYNYNLTGSDRKPLVESVSRILNCPAVYQGAPGFSYVIGGCVVNKNGVLSLGENTDPETAQQLIEALQQQGFSAENAVEENAASDSNSGVETIETITVPDQPDTLTVTVPDAGFTPLARDNLQKIVASKEILLKQALKTETLDIKEADGKISFPWFTRQGLEGEADAYNRLIAAICKMAKKQTRVTATEKSVENAKYEMRLFLIRLGFIGDEYKTARKILLRNLAGNSSWKSGHRPDQPIANIGAQTVDAKAEEP